MLVGQMVVKFAADLTNLTAGVRNSQSQMRSFSSTTQGAMSAVAAAEARASEQAHKLEIAQAQAAIALKKASDMASTGKASVEQQALANARAALAADKVRTAQIQATTAQERASSVAREFASEESSAADKSSRFGAAIVSARSSLARMTTSLTTAAGRMVEFGAHLTTLLGGVKSLITGAFDLGKQLLSPVMSAEQLGIAFTTLMGSTKAATREIKELNHFADITPFEPQDVQQYAAQLIGMGINAKQVVPIMTALGDALFAVGHGTPAEMASVVDILGKINVAGKITGEDIAQLQEHGIAAGSILAQAFHKTVPEILDMVSQGLIPADQAINALTTGIEGNPLYKGGMAKQANSLAGIMSTLTGYVTSAVNSFLGIKDGQVVAGSLFETLKNGLAQVGALAQNPAFQQFAQDMGAKAGQAVTNTANFIQTQLVPAFNNAVSTGQRVVKFFQDNEGAMNALKVTGAVALGILVAGFGALAISAGAAAIEVLAATWPILAIGAAIGLLIAGFMALYNNNAGFRSFVDSLVQGLQQLWQTVSTNLLPAWNNMVSFFQTTVMPILGQIGNFFVTTFQPAFKQIGDIIQNQLVPTWNNLMTSLQPAIPAFMAIAAIVGGILVTALGLAVAIVSGLIGAIAGALPGIIQMFAGLVQFVSGIIQFLSGIVAFIVDLFNGNFSKLGADLGLIWQGIVNMFGGVFNIIKGLFMAGLGWITGFVRGFIAGIVGFFTNLYNILVGHSIIPDLINSIVSWFMGLPGKVLAFISRLVSMAVGYFSVMAERAKAKVQELVNGIQNTISGLPGQALQWGQNLVSSFAQGIRNMAGQAGQAAQDVANGVKNFLGIHSPAKEGPLSELMDWPVNLVKSYAGQMSANTPLIERAVSDLVEPTTALNGRAGMSLSASGSGSGGAGASGGRGQQIIIIELDGNEIGRTVNDYQARELRVQGVIRR